MEVSHGEDLAMVNGNGGCPPEQALATSLQNTLAVKSKHIDSLVAHVRDLRTKLNHQSEEMAAFSLFAQERENILKQQNAQLSQQVLKLERTVSQQEKSNREGSEQLDAASRLAAERDGQVQRLKAQRQQYEEESRNAQDALQFQLGVLRDGKSKTVHTLQRKLKELEANAQQKDARLQSVESDRNSLLEKCKGMEESAESARHETTRLRADLQAVHGNGEVLRCKVEAVESANHQLQAVVLEKERDLATLRETNGNLSLETASAQERCHHLEDLQLEANREAAQRLNDVSLSVKRVVQECENLRTDLTTTHRAYSECQAREKAALSELDDMREQVTGKTAECNDLKASLKATADELQQWRNSQHAQHTENAMYQTLLKDQSELLSTVRKVAEEEAVRYQQLQLRLEQDLQAEKDRTESFSNQVAELKSSFARLHVNQSAADASLDSGLAVSTLSLAAAATRMATSSGSASEVISNLQQEAELLDIRLTEEMESHIVTLRRLHDMEEDNKRLSVLLAGSPVQERQYRKPSGSVTGGRSPGTNQQSPASRRSMSLSPVTSRQGSALTALSSVGVSPQQSISSRESASPEQDLSSPGKSTNSSPLARLLISNYNHLSSSPSQTHQSPSPSQTHQSPSQTHLSPSRSEHSATGAGSGAGGNGAVSTDTSMLSRSASPLSNQYDHLRNTSNSLPSTPPRSQRQPHQPTSVSPVAALRAGRLAWTSPPRKAHGQSDASLLASSLVRRALFQDLPARGERNGHRVKEPVSSAGGGEVAPLNVSMTDRLDALQRRYQDQAKSLQDKVAEVSSLQVELTSSNETSTDLRNRLKQFEMEMTSLQRNASEAAQQCHGHQQLLASRTEQLRQAQTEMEVLRTELRRSNQAVKDVLDLNWPVSDGEAPLACAARVLEDYYSLRRAVDSSEQRYNQCQALLRQKTTECEKCLEDINLLTSQHAEAFGRQAEENALRLESEKAAATKEQCQHREENNLLHSAVKDCNAQMKLVKAAHDREQSELHLEHQQALARKQSLAEEQMSAKQVEIGSLRCALLECKQQLTTEIEGLHAALSECKQQLASAHSNYDSGLAKSRDHSLSLVEQEQRVSDKRCAALSTECAVLRRSIEEYRVQLDAAERQYAESVVSVEILNAQISSEAQDTQELESSLNDEISRLEANLEVHVTQVSDLKNQLRDQELAAQARLQSAVHNEEMYKRDVATLQQTVEEKCSCLNQVNGQLLLAHQSLVVWWSKQGLVDSWRQLAESWHVREVKDKSHALFVALPAGSSLVDVARTTVSCHGHLQCIVDTVLNVSAAAMPQVPSSHSEVAGRVVGETLDSHAGDEMLPILDKVVAMESSQVAMLRCKLEEVMREREKTLSSCDALSGQLSQKSSKVVSLENEVRNLQCVVIKKLAVAELPPHTTSSSQQPMTSSVALATPALRTVAADHSDQAHKIEELNHRVQERDQLLDKAQEMLEQVAAENERLAQEITQKSGILPAGHYCRKCKSRTTTRQLTYTRMRLGYCLLELRLYKQVTEELQGRISQLELHLKLADNQYQLCHEKLLLAEEIGTGDDSFVEACSQSLSREQSPRRPLSREQSPRRRLSFRALRSPATSPTKRRSPAAALEAT